MTDTGLVSGAPRRASLDALFRPGGIAVIGGSRPGSPATRLIDNLRALDYPGPIYPVSARHSEVSGLPAVSGIEDLPAGLDLAVVAVSAGAVSQCLAECGEQGVRAALVLSSGFAESGHPDLQRGLADTARVEKMRVCGPNCAGFLNRTYRINANFANWTAAHPMPQAGPVALVSQSGGFGNFVMRRMASTGLGCNWFISTGNEVDVSVSEACWYVLDEPEVEVVLGFTETVTDAEQFVAAAELAQALDKPLVLLKAGRSQAAQKAALSHTASIAGSSATFDAVCRQYGVHIASSVDELIDLAAVFVRRRRSKGTRVGVLTASGGTGLLLTDALVLSGLEVPELPPAERAEMAKVLPDEFLGSLTNPVDISTQQRVVDNPYKAILQVMADSPSIDLLAPVAFHYAPQMVEAVREVYAASSKPMVVLSTGKPGDARSDDPPTFTDSRRAATAPGCRRQTVGLGAEAAHAAHTRTRRRSDPHGPSEWSRCYGRTGLTRSSWNPMPWECWPHWGLGSRYTSSCGRERRPRRRWSDSTVKPSPSRSCPMMYRTRPRWVRCGSG